MELLLAPVIIIALIWEGIKETWYIWVLLILGSVLFNVYKKVFANIDAANEKNPLKAYLSKTAIFNASFFVVLLVIQGVLGGSWFFYSSNELAAFILIALLSIHCFVMFLFLVAAGNGFEMILLWLSAIALGITIGIWGGREFSLSYSKGGYHVVAMDMEEAHPFVLWVSIFLIIYLLSMMAPLLVELYGRCKTTLANHAAERQKNQKLRNARAQIKKSLPKMDKIVKEYVDIKSNALPEETAVNLQVLYSLFNMTANSVDYSKVYREIDKIENVYKRKASLETEIQRCIEAYATIQDEEKVKYYSKLIQG